MDIKKNLTNIVVIIGLVGSIGAGFTKYGELTTRLDAVSNQTAPDLSKIEQSIQTNSLGVSDNVTEIVKINSDLKQDINKVNSELKQDINVVDQTVTNISSRNGYTIMITVTPITVINCYWSRNVGF